jgi:hypothetical protein
MARISSRPEVATDTAPTKVSAINRPKSISDTRSTGLSTGSRAFSAGRSLDAECIEQVYSVPSAA